MTAQDDFNAVLDKLKEAVSAEEARDANDEAEGKVDIAAATSELQGLTDRVNKLSLPAPTPAALPVEAAPVEGAPVAVTSDLVETAPVEPTPAPVEPAPAEQPAGEQPAPGSSMGASSSS